MTKGFLNSIIISLAVAFTSICFILPGRLQVLLLIAFLATAVAFRLKESIHISLFCLLMVLFPLISPLKGAWPWFLLGPLSIYHLIVCLVPFLRRSYIWLGMGRISKDVSILMLITTVISASALVGWYKIMAPDLYFYLGEIQEMPLILMPFAGLGFSILNAVMEEVAFRGVIMNGMDAAFNFPAVSITAQAMSFGMMHYASGFPNGVTGVLMVLIYGLLTGVIRNRSRGMLAPVITHFFADLTIFIILATLIR